MYNNSPGGENMTDILAKIPNETEDRKFVFDDPKFPTRSIIRVIDDIVSDENGFTIKGHWEKAKLRTIRAFFL
jgi:hypothetical protein